ncbi:MULTISPECIES: heavy metal sensor histidine kinase [unclassified Paraburkholderia]|uniref:heavy metal sensor histidine kinase n=1 Tax=unclassified Paraburkholderia TaxID=2615204 RepID=UPI002AAF4E1D|nr:MULTISPECIES: heavy metal sensor histidine kinase [unclassified Paraburkholderia]
MARRSLALTLALVFSATTLAVFACVGWYLYVALAHQVRKQDDQEIVLAARHVRRLAAELASTQDARLHAQRLSSAVLGNQAMAMRIVDAQGATVSAHDEGETFDEPPKPPTHAVTADDVDLSPSRAGALVLAPNARIIDTAIREWRSAQGVPVRSIALDVALRNGETVRVGIARDLRGPLELLDSYRDTLWLAGSVGTLVVLLGSYALVRLALRPLRQIADQAREVTAYRLDQPIRVKHIPAELATLVASLNAMLERLHAGFQRLSQFTTDLAHDMRTPLGNLRGATEIALARPRSDEEYQVVLASNLEECERLSRMIENVIFLARAEHPRFEMRRREFDLRDELERIVEYFEGLADEAGISIRVEGDAQLSADVELFRRALSNLIANALRYTPAGGAILLAVAVRGDSIDVVVENPGAPIPAEFLERIFERFYRVDPSRAQVADSAGASAGLGLAIVRSVMELHGGKVRAESDERSTRFILTFPHA